MKHSSYRPVDRQLERIHAKAQYNDELRSRRDPRDMPPTRLVAGSSLLKAPDHRKMELERTEKASKRSRWLVTGLVAEVVMIFGGSF